MIIRVTVLALVVYVCIALALFVVHHDDRPIKADAIIVLAGTTERLPVGQALIRKGFAPLLVVSLSRPTSHQQAAVCQRRQSFRVLCFRARPFETRGEAEAIGRLATRFGWKRIDVVTSQFHIVRARTLIRRCYHGALAMVGAPQSNRHLPLDVLAESAKLVYQQTLRRSC